DVERHATGQEVVSCHHSAQPDGKPEQHHRQRPWAPSSHPPIDTGGGDDAEPGQDEGWSRQDDESQHHTGAEQVAASVVVSLLETTKQGEEEQRTEDEVEIFAEQLESEMSEDVDVHQRGERQDEDERPAGGQTAPQREIHERDRQPET